MTIIIFIWISILPMIFPSSDGSFICQCGIPISSKLLILKSPRVFPVEVFMSSDKDIIPFSSIMSGSESFVIAAFLIFSNG
jgi:hypothetical protein